MRGRTGIKKAIRISVFASTLALVASPLLPQWNRGADVVVTRKDSTQLTGELFAVKHQAVLIRSESLKAWEDAESIAVQDINIVKIRRKSKTLLGMGLGSLAGVGIGALMDGGSRFKGVFAFGGGLFGLIIGGVYGAAYEASGEIFYFRGRRQDQIESELLKLSDYAALKGIR